MRPAQSRVFISVRLRRRKASSVAAPSGASAFAEAASTVARALWRTRLWTDWRTGRWNESLTRPAATLSPLRGARESDSSRTDKERQVPPSLRFHLRRKGYCGRVGATRRRDESAVVWSADGKAEFGCLPTAATGSPRARAEAD
jgi:hypothetical protein